MDTKEKQEKEEVISIAELLSEEELKEIGLSEEEIKNPTEETIQKIRKHFQNKAKEN